MTRSEMLEHVKQLQWSVNAIVERLTAGPLTESDAAALLNALAEFSRAAELLACRAYADCVETGV